MLTQDELVKSLQGLSSWNTTARNLVRKAGRGQTLSKRQLQKANGIVNKYQSEVEIDFEFPQSLANELRSFFVEAKLSGKQKELLLPGMTIALCQDTEGLGSIMFHTGLHYVGRLNRQGEFVASGEGEVDVIVQELRKFVNDPGEMIGKHGREIGQCPFCHKKLHNPWSVRHGFGPVCGKRFGLVKVRPGTKIY